MGLDRHEYIRQECPCGRGELEIDYCLADHPWAKPDSGNFQLSIKCEQCRKEFKLIEQNAEAIIIDRSEFEKREAESNQLYQRRRQIDRLKIIQEYLTEFENRLLAKNTATDKYRFFQAAGFHMPSIGKFRTELKQEKLENIIRNKFSISCIPRLVQVLGKKNDDLVLEIQTIEQREKELRRPFEAIGKPIAVLTPEAFYGR